MMLQTVLLTACVVAASASTFVDMSPKVQKAFLAEHNRIRRAKGQPKLTWSNKLAAFAKNDSPIKGCTMKHTANPTYGENIYYAAGSNMAASKLKAVEVAQKASRAWESEIKLVTPNWSCMNAYTCLHYTQQIWPLTTQMGCAMLACPGKGMPKVFVYREYFPRGNMGTYGKTWAQTMAGMGL